MPSCTPRSRHRRLGLVLLAAVAAVNLILTGCARTVSGAGAIGREPDASLSVAGDSGSAFDVSVKNALSDVSQFWRSQYPKVSGGKRLPELEGALYSVDGLAAVRAGGISGPAADEACATADPSFIVDNGAYCRIDDSIIWDRSQSHLFGQLREHYGDLVIGLIFAHEFGHAVQQRLGIFQRALPTIYTESQADCAAGAWAAEMLANHARHFRGMQGQLDTALEGFLDGRDSTPDDATNISHGDGFDRIAAIDDGIAHGVTFCYSPNYFSRQFTERPYVTDNDHGIIDKARQGNEALSSVLDATPPSRTSSGGGGLQPDLNRFWRAAAASIHKRWTDVNTAEAPHPPCGPSPQSEFGYCPATNTVYYSQAFAADAYNSLPDLSVDQSTGDVHLLFHRPADFALGTLFVVAWGLAVRHQLLGLSTDGTEALLAASCYAGAYAKDVNRATNADGRRLLELSPPDMDEATSAMLTLTGSARAFGARGTTGRERIQYFVKGYLSGLRAC